MPVFCFPWSPVACKVFLKKCLLLKWPHWGCSICTGWKLPNSVLHIEEKSRGQKFLSTEIWRKLRCLQNSIHNQTASGSAYFRGAGEKQNKKKATWDRKPWVFCDVQTAGQPMVKWLLVLHFPHVCHSSCRDCIAQLICETNYGVAWQYNWLISVLHQGGQKVIKKK